MEVAAAVEVEVGEEEEEEEATSFPVGNVQIIKPDGLFNASIKKLSFQIEFV